MLVGADKINPKQITKEILDALVYLIIVVDKENAAFLINVPNTLKPEQVRKRRHEFLIKEAIHEN